MPFLEPLKIDGRQLHPADERFAFAEAVAIGAAGDQQVMAVGDLQVILGHGRRVFGMETFQAVQARCGQRRNDFVAAIQAGMGHRPPARRPDGSGRWPPGRRF